MINSYTDANLQAILDTDNFVISLAQIFMKEKKKKKWFFHELKLFLMYSVTWSIHQRHVNIVNVPKPIVFLYTNKIPTSCHLARHQNSYVSFDATCNLMRSCQKLDEKSWNEYAHFHQKVLFNSPCVGNLKYKYTLINSSTCITYPLPGLVLKRFLHNNDRFVLVKTDGE